MSKHSIGNDIVDLRYSEPALHPRFTSRVFSASEIEQLHKDPARLWRLWSAKEAAYKAVKRLDPQIIFSPIKFVCNEELDCVAFENYQLSCQNILTEDYSYTVCASSSTLLNSPDLFNWIDEVEFLSVKHADRLSDSEAVRSLAITNISTILNIPAHHISIPLISPSNGKSLTLPSLINEGKTSSSLLSFSHHGRFVSCAYFRKD